MSDPLRVTGMVLESAPAGDYDRRILLLTKERGKITAFARGARKPKSELLSATSPFIFGTFTVYEGRSAYTLVGADIDEYFTDVRSDMTLTCYACYFMELASYYTRENLECTQLLNLLYATLRALPRKEPDNELIRCIFEMKAMVLDGEYPYDAAKDKSLLEKTRQTLNFVLQAPIKNLYRFTVPPEVFREFRRVQDHYNSLLIDRKFRSLEVLKQMIEN